MSEKPFACNDKNCNMTFANEDHLNSHKKKHTMSFSLELASKNNEAAIIGDQTPTPTSFFRNCEEVGLFQDLQNVNPFEETFKKALENSENEGSKVSSLSLVINEDTLHTPHVFPASEETLSKSKAIDNNNELLIANFVEIPKINEHVNSTSETDLDSKLKVKQENPRHKLKEALLNKKKIKNIQYNVKIPKIDISCTTNSTIGRNMIYVSNENLVNNKLESDSLQTCRKSHISPEHNSSLQKVREMNRAAQMRCRIKKKRLFDRMAAELGHLKTENVELKAENARLSQTTMRLCRILEAMGGIKDTNIFNDAVVIDTYGNKTNAQKSSQESTLKKLPVLAPAKSKSPPINEPPSPSPIIYNLVPIQMLISNPNSIYPLDSVVSPEMKKKKTLPRILRKT